MSAMPLLSPGKRIALTLTVTAAGGVALLGLKPHAVAHFGASGLPAPTAGAGPGGAASGPTAGSGSTGSGGTGSGSTGTGGTGSGTTGGGTRTGGSEKTGITRTVDGAVVQTRYGPVQVQITLSAGRLTAVKILQVPDGNPRDQEIASFSVPQLTQEALAAQSARIDTVSGATYTSEGYAQSLQSALDKAHG